MGNQGVSGVLTAPCELSRLRSASGVRAVVYRQEQIDNGILRVITIIEGVFFGECDGGE